MNRRTLLKALAASPLGFLLPGPVKPKTWADVDVKWRNFTAEYCPKCKGKGLVEERTLTFDDKGNCPPLYATKWMNTTMYNCECPAGRDRVKRQHKAFLEAWPKWNASK